MYTFTVMQFTDSEINAIKHVCEKHKVKHLYAFGSVLGKEYGPSSDVDLLVEINSTDPYEYTDHYYGLLEDLESILKRKIDLLEVRAQRNEYVQRELDKSKVAIYG